MKKLIISLLVFLSCGFAQAEKFSVKAGNSTIDIYAERTIAVLQKYIPDEDKRQKVIDEIFLLAKVHKTTPDEILTYIKSFDNINFWDRYRALLRQH